MVAKFLNKYPATRAAIGGHTDDVGDSDRNLSLSQRKAQSVVNYLINTYNIARNLLSATGFGETKPVADNRRNNAVISCAQDQDIEGLESLKARVTMALNIQFARNQSTISEDYYAELARVGKFLNENSDVTATVEGHTDNTSPATAMAVSEARAQKVVDYLVNQVGVDRARLRAEGFGHTRRFAYGATPEGCQQNRRVNIIINYPNP